MPSRTAVAANVRPRSAGAKARKERERSARRHEIVHAARAVFAEKGFANATLEEIAERAGFGKGTVYNYFESKETLFSAAIADLLDDVTAIARDVSVMDLPIREALTEYVKRMIAYYEANFDFCRMMMSEWVRPELEGVACPIGQIHARIQMVAEPLAQLFKSAMRRRLIRRSDPMILAKMFIGIVHDYYVMNMVPPLPAKTVRAQTEMIVSVFFEGIVATATRAKA